MNAVIFIINVCLSWFLNVNAQMLNKVTNIILMYDVMSSEFKIKEKLFFSQHDLKSL